MSRIDKGKQVVGATDAEVMAAQLGRKVSGAEAQKASAVTKGSKASPATSTNKGYIDASAAKAASQKFVSAAGSRGMNRFAGAAPAATHTVSESREAPNARHVAAAKYLSDLVQTHPEKAAAILSAMFQSAELVRTAQGQLTTEGESHA